MSKTNADRNNFFSFAAANARAQARQAQRELNMRGVDELCDALNKSARAEGHAGHIERMAAERAEDQQQRRKA